MDDREKQRLKVDSSNTTLGRGDRERVRGRDRGEDEWKEGEGGFERTQGEKGAKALKTR